MYSSTNLFRASSLFIFATRWPDGPVKPGGHIAAVSAISALPLLKIQCTEGAVEHPEGKEKWEKVAERFFDTSHLWKLY